MQLLNQKHQDGICGSEFLLLLQKKNQQNKKTQTKLKKQALR